MRLLDCSLIRNVEDRAAGLAVNGVPIMPLQCADRTGILHLVGPEQDLHEAQEQRHTEDHDHHRDQVTYSAFGLGLNPFGWAVR